MNNQQNRQDSLSKTIVRRWRGSTVFLCLCLSFITVSSACAQASTNCVPCPSGLIAWWPGDGDAVNLAGSGDGTLRNGASYEVGEVGQAFNLNGTSAYIEVADSQSLSLPGGMTIAMWVMPDVPLSQQRPWARFATKNDGELGMHGWQIITTGSQSEYPSFGLGNLLFECYDAAGNWRQALTADADLLPPNTFSHLAAIYDPQQGDMVIYVNGVTVARTNVGTFQIPSVPNPLRIGLGNWSESEEYFYGRIDEVILFNRALSSDEIAAICTTGTNGMCKSALPPTLLSWPVEQSVASGSNITLVAVASGTPPLSYQWLFYGTNLPWATNASLQLTAASLSDSGPYAVVVRNGYGTAVSPEAQLTVIGPPIITVHPQSQVLPLGYPAGFSVSAESIAPLSYQWLKDGTVLPGLTTASFVISAVQADHAGVYCCLVSNLAGTTLSSNGTLTVLSGDCLILSEDFEDGVLDPRMTTSTVGGFVYWPGIKEISEFGSARAYGFGRSECPASCFDNYMSRVTISFAQPTFISRIEFDEMELYGNWGSWGGLFLDGEFLPDFYFQRLPANDLQPDTSFRSHALAIGRSLTNVTFHVSDITQSSELFMDNVKVFGECPSQTNCVPCPSGLIAWWPGDGSANDLAGLNHGSLLGGAGFERGLVDHAFLFRETNDCVEVPDSPVLPGNGSFTVEAWIKPNIEIAQQAQWPKVVSKQDWSNTNVAPGWSLYCNGTASEWPGHLGFGVQDEAGNAGFATTTVNGMAPAHAWTHVAGVYDKDAGYLRFYLNGTLQQETDASGLGSINAAVPLYVGASGSTGWDHFDGAIDEVSVYNRALAGNEIAAIHAAGASGKCKGLTAPTILVPPTNVVTLAGWDANLHVAASGSPPLGYQWLKGGTSLDETARIHGVRTSHLTISNVDIGDTGVYSVIVSNLNGTATSTPALLSVVSTNLADQPTTLQIDPKRSCLLCNNDPDALSSIPVDLLLLGLQPGDEVFLERLGAWEPWADRPDTNDLLTGVFSSSDLLLSSANLRRVPGAIEAGEDFVTWNTHFGDLPTDIPEDFQVTATTIRIPAGARYLFVAAVDGYYGDNRDSDNDFALRITKRYPSSARELYTLGYTNNGTYTIDPDGPGGQAPLKADCLMSLSGGGWTKLTAAVANTPLNTDANVYREYLYVQNGTVRYYRTPVSRLVWSWSSGKDLYGTYYFSTGAGESAFNVTPSGEHQSYGVGGSSGGGPKYKCLVIYPTCLNPANAGVMLCQDRPGIFCGACCCDVSVYMRELLGTTITGQPLSRTNVVGTTAFFGVQAFGSDPLIYQWQCNGTNLVDGGRISGATSAALSLASVQPTDAGNYTVIVSGPAGTVTSAVAQLTVINECTTVSVMSPTYAVGSAVPLYVRSFDCVNKNPLPNIQVIVYITVAGTTRTVRATTDAKGEAMEVFTPLAGEVGWYEVSAGLPSQAQPPAQDEFAIVGVEFSPAQVAHRLIVGAPVTNQVQIRNLTDVPLSEIAITLLNPPPGLIFEASTPETLEGFGTNTLTYVVTATAANPSGTSLLRFTSAEGATNYLPIVTEIVPPVPALMATPGSLQASMFRGEQTLMELKLANTGGAAAHDIQVIIPNEPWFSVVSPRRIALLGAGETTTVILALTPAADLALGPYRSHILFHAVEQDLTVPYEFNCISARPGDLQVTAIDEFTYLAAGAPKVTNATVTVADYWTGLEVTNGVTDFTGSVLFTNLTEAYYDIRVSAPKHGGFGTTLLLLAGKTNDLVAFLTRETVSYNWEVVPTEDPDHYDIRLVTTFEVAVPWPSLTVYPSDLNLCEYQEGTHDVYLTITNHGLIKASDLTLSFPTHPAWEVIPLTGTIGELAAQSSVVVPVRVRRIASNGNVASRMDGRLDYTFTGDNLVFPRSVPIPVWNANAWDCVAPPWISIEPAELNMCSFADDTNVTFTIRNRGTMGVEGMVLAFPQHEHWQIVPDLTPIGSLPAQTTRTVSVLFHKVSSPTSGPSRIEGNLSYQATLQGETRQFYRKTRLYNPNPWNCVPTPLLTINPGSVDLCSVASGTTVSFTIYNQSLVLADNLTLNLPSHPYWNLQPAQNNLGTLGPLSSRTVDVLFTRISSVTDGPSTIPGQMGYRATVEGETRNFAEPVPLYNANPWDCVPMPPVIIEPSYINLCGMRSMTNPVVFTIINRSMLEAEIPVLVFDDSHPDWEIRPVQTNLSTIGALATRQVLVEFVRTPQSSLGSSAIPARFDYRATLGIQPRDFSLPIHIYNANDEDCVVQPGGGGGGTTWPQDHNYVHVRGKLLFQQQVTVARNVFTATLELVNNSSTSPLTLISVNLDLRDEAGLNATNRFGVRLEKLTGLTAIDGTGVLNTNASGIVSWKLVPANNATPTGPTIYTVGGEFTFMQDGELVTVHLYPVPIKVMPDPHLCLDYFWEKTAYSDDPLTTAIEPAVPFGVGLIMRNDGYGTAKAVKVETMKPRIVENKSGLLISFNLLEAQVGGLPAPPKLELELGDIAPGTTKEALWWMSSSLLADFIEYEATFSHVDWAEQRNLSLIDCVNIHPTLHVVRADVPADDFIPDFLAMDAFPTNTLPDMLYLSDGSALPVTPRTDAFVDGPPSITHTNVTLTVPIPLPSGWVYLRINNPSRDFPLRSVKRSDRREVLMNWNVWTTYRIVYPLVGDPYEESFLHILDKDTTGSYILGYNLALYIVEHPRSRTNVLGTTAVFGVVAGGTTPFSYQWQKFGTNLAGATQSVLTITNVQVSDEGWYSVLVTNLAGQVRSEEAWLEVVVPPTITVQPQDQPILVGTPASFQVEATGDLPLTYQWFRNDVAMPGATGTMLVIQKVQTSDAGRYKVDVSNAAGLTPSRQATLDVLVPPTLCQVRDQEAVVGRLLVITNCASDPDLPISFSLGLPKPEGATITTNGVFRWTPLCQQGNSTNLVTVWATDNGIIPTSNSVTFVIRVLECIEVALGNAVVQAGQTGAVTLALTSPTIITNLSFTMLYAQERFTTNFALSINSPEILATNYSVVRPGELEVSFTLSPNQAIYGPTNVGLLGFETVRDQVSDFVWLSLTNVVGLKPLGEKAENAQGYPGRVVVVGYEPLLEAVLLPEQVPALILYASPGSTNALQSATNLKQPTNWQPYPEAPEVIMPTNELLQVIQPIVIPDNSVFFRALRQ